MAFSLVGGQMTEAADWCLHQAVRQDILQHTNWTEESGSRCRRIGFISKAQTTSPRPTNNWRNGESHSKGHNAITVQVSLAKTEQQKETLLITNKRAGKLTGRAGNTHKQDLQETNSKEQVLNTSEGKGEGSVLAFRRLQVQIPRLLCPVTTAALAGLHDLWTTASVK